jgi:hypothetical protein
MICSSVYRLFFIQVIFLSFKITRLGTIQAGLVLGGDVSSDREFSTREPFMATAAEYVQLARMVLQRKRKSNNASLD